MKMGATAVGLVPAYQASTTATAASPTAPMAAARHARAMDEAARRALLATYREGYQAVVDALSGADDADLDRRPAAGEWTARQVVHHLADSEMTSAIRLRRLLAEDDPVIAGY